MAVVVSDTTPLHYLILIGQASLLEKLYGQVFVPPAVMLELCHPSAPPEVSAWMKSPPDWLWLQSPTRIPPHFDHLDMGERQALSLAKEIHADWILLDDKVARRHAEGEDLKVKGTIGILADAAHAGLVNFRAAVEKLQQTSMYLAPQVAQRLIAEYENRSRPGKHCNVAPPTKISARRAPRN